MRLRICAILIGVLSLVSDFSLAETTTRDNSHGHGDHGDAPRLFAGAKASYLAAFHDGHVIHLAGGGVFFEYLAIPGWLEIELFARIMGGGDLIMFPIDLVLKMPFHINETLHPFLGLGATVVPERAHGVSEVFFGGVLAAGSYFWLTRSTGLVFEFNYNFVYAHGPVNELGINGGIVFGW